MPVTVQSKSQLGQSQLHGNSRELHTTPRSHSTLRATTKSARVQASVHPQLLPPAHGPTDIPPKRDMMNTTSTMAPDTHAPDLPNPSSRPSTSGQHMAPQVNGVKRSFTHLDEGRYEDPRQVVAIS